MSKLVYKCPCCERVLTGLPALAFGLPDFAAAIAKHEVEGRVSGDDDRCVVDDEHYFIRATMSVPIIGATETLEFSIWGTVSQDNFDRYQATFHEDHQSRLGTMFSWFASRLPLYEVSTLSLRGCLFLQDGRKRPVYEIDPSETHQIVTDIRNGITRERALEFAALVLPRH